MQVNRAIRGFVFMAMCLLSAVSCINDIYEVDDYSDGSIRFDVKAKASVVTKGTSEDAASSITYLESVALLGERGDTLYIHPSVSPTPINVGPETKGLAVTNNSITDFTVRAYNSDGALYKGDTKVNKTDATWLPDSLFLWPVNGKLDFYAYKYGTAVGGATPSSLTYNTTNHSISFDWTTPVSENKLQDAKSQPDLIFAFNNADRKTLGSEKVQMNFYHALSEVKFKVGDVFNGKLKTIKIEGLYGRGTCTFDGDITEKNTDINPVSWVLDEDTKGSVAYTQTFNVAVKDPYPNTNPTPQEITDVYPETTFMMIPQTLQEQATVTVTLDRIDGDTTEEIVLTGKINVDWAAGYTYTYVISTDSVNWIYVFDVIGSNQTENVVEPATGVFSDAEGIIEINPTVTEGSYYKVQSYRYRANHPETVQAVPWSAVPSEGTTSIPTDWLTQTGLNYDDIPGRIISSDIWMPNLKLTGTGYADKTYEKVAVIFDPQMVVTDWIGDHKMLATEYRNDESNLIDLSIANVYGQDAGKTNDESKINSANCYVVNSAGYYKFPLIYGNAIVDGQTNSQSYSFTPGTITHSNTVNEGGGIRSSNASGGNYRIYYPLNQFVNYEGRPITSPKVEGGNDAVLVWQDAYNLISDVELVHNGTGGYDYITFKVNRDNIQQGNAVLAVRDANKNIIWSWHIWINEMWPDANLKLGTGTHSTNGIGAGANVTVAAHETTYLNSFTVAPYNLGWCDPKNVLYLARTGNMVFTQNISGKQENLNIKQRDQVIEYWIGNNTYYQFGRKDPIVGFMNNNSTVKYNFGNYTYQLEKQTKSIDYSIKNPNVLFVGADAEVGNNDWASTLYYNLWNNYPMVNTTEP